MSWYTVAGFAPAARLFVAAGPALALLRLAAVRPATARLGSRTGPVVVPAVAVVVPALP